MRSALGQRRREHNLPGAAGFVSYEQPPHGGPCPVCSLVRELDTLNRGLLIPVTTVSPTTARKPELPALSGIRTLLAIFILLFHFTPPHSDFLHPIINNSFIFVGTFFLISGFILTYHYADRALTMHKRDFWLARFARLYPTYAFVLLLSTPLLWAEWQARPHGEFWAGLLVTPLLLQGWSPSLATFWNTVAWTLSADLLLYLLFPYILRFWAERLEYLNRPGRLVAVIVCLWLLGIAPHTWYHLTNPDHLAAPADRFTGTFWIRMLKYCPLAYLCTFLVGQTLARLHALLRLNARQRFTMASIALAGILLFFYRGAPHVPYVIIHGALLLPLFCLLVLGLAGPNPVASVFAMRPLVVFGEATFALYLLHFNVFELIHQYHLPERVHLAQFDPWVSYAAILTLAYGTVRFVERPARRAILARLGRRPQAEPRLQATSA